MLVLVIGKCVRYFRLHKNFDLTIRMITCFSGNPIAVGSDVK